MNEDQEIESSAEGMENGLATGLDSSSPFAVIEGKAPPVLRWPALPWLIGFPIILAVSFLYVFYIGVNGYGHIGGIIVLISLILATIVYSANRLKSKVDALFELLASLTMDLESLSESLENYLKKFEDRSRRVFNSMKPNEVASHYFLTQLRHALHQRVDILKNYLMDPTIGNLSVAYELLQEPLSVREGVLQRKGNVVAIPVREIRPTASKHIVKLENSLAKIEREKSEQASYEAVDLDDYDEDPQ